MFLSNSHPKNIFADCLALNKPVENVIKRSFMEIITKFHSILVDMWEIINHARLYRYADYYGGLAMYLT